MPQIGIESLLSLGVHWKPQSPAFGLVDSESELFAIESLVGDGLGALLIEEELLFVFLFVVGFVEALVDLGLIVL